MKRIALTARHLELGYGRHTVVHDVGLTIEPGTVTALVGPNGSGKSTVLRSLARLHDITSGEVGLTIGGGPTSETDSGPVAPTATAPSIPATALSAKEFATLVTLLSQSRPHPSGVSVGEVVAFGRHPHRRRFAALTDEDREAITRATDLTGISGMMDRPVDQLSGGELQRVWVATCLAQDTGVLLLDEPTNHLDLRYQMEVLDLMRELAEDHGTAVGVVLHDLNHAALVADTVLLLSAGRVIAEGPCHDVLDSALLSPAYGIDIATHYEESTGMLRIEPVPRRCGRSRSIPI